MQEVVAVEATAGCRVGVNQGRWSVAVSERATLVVHVPVDSEFAASGAVRPESCCVECLSVVWPFC